MSKRRTRFQQIVLDHLRGVRGSLVVAFVSILGLTLTDLLRPWPVKIIFDHILLDEPLPSFLAFLDGVLQSGKVTAVVVVSVSIVLITLLAGVFSYSQVYITSRISNQLVDTLRRELFAHLQRLSLAFHHYSRSGELLTKIVSDTNTVKDIVAESALTFLSQILIVIGVFAIMFALNWKLALIVLATVPFLLGNLVYRYRRAKDSARRQRTKEERLATQINEVLGTTVLVQAFGREKYEERRFEAESAAYVEENIRNARIEAMATRAVEMTGAVGTGAVVLFGSLQVLAGQMTLGSVLIFTSYLSSLYRPIRNLAKPLTRFSKAAVSAGRITEILEVEPQIHDEPDAIRASTLKGEIVFENVSFDYGDGRLALKDVSFVISPGQRVAFVGASGAGKSTLVSLILRLYDPQQGSISIDGVNIKTYQRESLRREIGIVLQESLLLGATIQENIAYGKLDATMDEIRAAASAANAHDFIMELPDRYDTVIGERGDTLSGGQRRRIAIARAFVRNAPILILDEPTAGLDIENEAHVREALVRLMGGKTCLMITHDLRALTDLDPLILVLDEGRLLEQGTHRDLVTTSARYRQLYGFTLEKHAAARERSRRPEEPPQIPAEPPRRAPVPIEPALPRLPVLLDPVAMAPFLHRSLGPDAPFPAVQIRSLRYKPRTNLVVLYDVGLEGRSYEAIAMIAARRSLAHLAAKPQNVALARLVDGRSPAPMPLYYERKLDALIQWFPLDLDLPTLAEPPGRLLEELQAAGINLDVVDGDPATLAYKPRRQAVLSVGSHVLKLYAEREQFDRAAAGLRVAGGLHAIRTSGLEADLPARLLTVQKRLSGSPPSRAAAVARDAGELLRELHGACAPVAPPDAALQAGLKASLPSHQLASTEACAKYVAALLPALGGRLQGLLRQIEAAVPRIDRLVLSHGDFTARQLLMTPDGLAAIDWDSMRLAPAALDPAMYVARLVSREADDLDKAFEVLEELLEGYGRRPPGLAWYLATAIIGRSPEPFRYQDEHWPERIEGMVTASEAALRLDGQQPSSLRRSRSRAHGDNCRAAG